MSKIIPSVEVNHRVDFPLLCDARGIVVAVEVGTDRGVFAKQFMERFTGAELICIDPYNPYEELPGTRWPDMLQAILALQEWHGRVRMLQHHSPEVISKMPLWMTRHVGFVYIDGSHLYEEVLRDIKAWWKVIQKSESKVAILAGHDYDPTHPGVMRAVEEFSSAHDLIVRTVDGDNEPSWYIYREEPTTLFQRFWRSGEMENK